MPRYRFWVRGGRFSNALGVEAALEDTDAAWKEAAAICADLARDIVTDLKAEPEWLLEATDEAGQGLFRFRIVAESLERKVAADRFAVRKVRAPRRVGHPSAHQRFQR
jgi:hypothetical protein